MPSVSRKASPAHQRVAEKTKADDGDDPSDDGESDVAVEDPGQDNTADQQHDAQDGGPHLLEAGAMVDHRSPFRFVAAMLPRSAGGHLPPIVSDHGER